MKGGIAKVAAAAAAGALVLTSCSGGDATSWANDLCGDIAPDVKALKTPPNIDPSDPQKAKESLSGYIDTAVSSIDNIIGSINDAGDPPVDGGAEAADKVEGALGKVKDALGRAKTAIDGADVSNPQSAQEAFTKVGQEMSSVGQIGDPTAGLKSSEEMDKAFKEAENCKALQ